MKSLKKKFRSQFMCEMLVKFWNFWSREYKGPNPTVYMHYYLAHSELLLAREAHDSEPANTLQLQLNCLNTILATNTNNQKCYTAVILDVNVLPKLLAKNKRHSSSSQDLLTELQFTNRGVTRYLRRGLSMILNLKF